MKQSVQLIIAMCIFLSSSAVAQFNQIWGSSFSHTGALNYSNESRKVITDPNGNIFMLADVTSDIDPAGNVTTSTYHYVVVAKYDINGTFIKKFDILVNNHLVIGQNNYAAFGLELDATNNVYVGYNYVDMNSGSDIRVTKFNNNLVLDWTMKYNPVSADYGTDMKVNSLNEVYVIGRSILGTNISYRVLKTDLVQSTLFPAYTFDPNIDVLSALAIDGNNYVYVTGNRLVGGFKTVMTASIDNLGNLRWKSIYNGGSAVRDDFGTDIVYGVDGFVYITGTSDQGFPTINDFLIMKYDPSNGKKIWITFHHIGPDDNGLFISSIDPVYVYVGSTSGSNSVVLNRISANNGALSGNLVYQPVPSRPYTSINHITLNDFAVSNSGSFYITGNIIALQPGGQTFSAAYFTKFKRIVASRVAFKIDIEEPAPGEFAESYEGNGIAFLYNNNTVLWLHDKIINYANHSREIIELNGYGLPSGLRAEDFSSDDFSVATYPNPVKDNFDLISDFSRIDKLQIFDTRGSLIIEQAVNSFSSRVDISNLNSGIYLLKVYDDQGTCTIQKIVKE